jgi:hypothetical protein
MLSSHLRLGLPSGLFPSGLATKIRMSLENIEWVRTLQCSVHASLALQHCRGDSSITANREKEKCDLSQNPPVREVESAMLSAPEIRYNEREPTFSLVGINNDFTERKRR